MDLRAGTPHMGYRVHPARDLPPGRIDSPEMPHLSPSGIQPLEGRMQGIIPPPPQEHENEQELHLLNFAVHPFCSAGGVDETEPQLHRGGQHHGILNSCSSVKSVTPSFRRGSFMHAPNSPPARMQRFPSWALSPMKQGQLRKKKAGSDQDLIVQEECDDDASVNEEKAEDEEADDEAEEDDNDDYDDSDEEKDKKPSRKKDEWTEQEDATLKEAHAKMGNCWKGIAKLLPRRSLQDVTKRWKEQTHEKALADMDKAFAADDSEVLYMGKDDDDLYCLCAEANEFLEEADHNSVSTPRNRRGQYGWSADEDRLIRDWGRMHGSMLWDAAATAISRETGRPQRSGKCCRQRW